MADYSYLTRDDTALSDFSGTGYPGHGCHGGVGTHTHIVRYLAKVVYSHAVFNDGGLHRSLVDAGVGADFHVIANDYIAYVFNLLPGSVALWGIAEAVIADRFLAVDAFVDIETQGLCDGASVVYRTKYYPGKTQNCQVAVKADTKKFFEIFFGYLFSDYKDIVIQSM